MNRITLPLYLALAALALPQARAAKNDWAEGTPGKGNGASREYYNSAASLPWKNTWSAWLKEVTCHLTPLRT